MKKLVLLLLTTLFLFTYSCGGEDSVSKSEFKERILKICESKAKTPEEKAECKDDVNEIDIDNCKDYDGEAAYKVIESFDKMEKCIKAAGDDLDKLRKCSEDAKSIEEDLKKVCSNYEEVFAKDYVTKSEFKEKSLKICESNAKTPEKKAECKGQVNKIDNCKDYDGKAAYKVIESFDKMEKCFKAAGDDQDEKLKCFAIAMAIQTNVKKVCSNYEEVFQSDPE